MHGTTTNVEARMASDIGLPLADSVAVSADMLTVHLKDGRSIAVPLVWFARLMHGTKRERDRCQIIGKGDKLRWPDLGETIVVADLLAGRMSHEPAISLERWLSKRPVRRQRQKQEKVVR
jgi:hypothetical protein